MVQQKWKSSFISIMRGNLMPFVQLKCMISLLMVSCAFIGVLGRRGRFNDAGIFFHDVSDSLSSESYWSQQSLVNPLHYNLIHGIKFIKLQVGLGLQFYEFHPEDEVESQRVNDKFRQCFRKYSFLTYWTAVAFTPENTVHVSKVFDGMFSCLIFYGISACWFTLSMTEWP